MSFIIVKRAKSQIQGAQRPLQASALPHEHKVREAAITEARRLASENPNFQFVVMEACHFVQASVTLEEQTLR